MREKILVSWSGGKDSSFALYKLISSGEFEIAALLTTVTEGYERISMHGVRKILLEKQAENIGTPLDIIYISQSADNAEYENKMREKLIGYKNAGVKRIGIGDIFLEDLRRHREEKLAEVGMSGIFPLWKIDTAELAENFIASGFRSIITCVDSQKLDGAFASRYYDRQLLKDLPKGVDPCGENGEFHSFVFDGPIFKNPVAFQKGEVVLRENRFYFCDLIPE